MSESDRALGLSGVWSGEYWYGAGNERIKFAANLLETTGSLAGTTLEPAPPSISSNGELGADLTGVRDGQDVRFTKVYSTATERLAPIAYSGLADADLLVIEGGWRIGGVFSVRGGFIMRRVTLLKERISEKASAATPREGIDAIAMSRQKSPIEAD